MDINPWYMYDQEKWPKLNRLNIFELSVLCERAHYKLQKNVRIVRNGSSKLTLWLNKLERFQEFTHECYMVFSGDAVPVRGSDA